MARRDEGFSQLPVVTVAIPLLLVLFLVCVEVGQWTYTWARAVSAARAGAESGTRGEVLDGIVRAALSRRLAEGAVVERVPAQGRLPERIRVEVERPSVLGGSGSLPPIEVEVAVASSGRGGVEEEP